MKVKCKKLEAKYRCSHCYKEITTDDLKGWQSLPTDDCYCSKRGWIKFTANIHAEYES